MCSRSALTWQRSLQGLAIRSGIRRLRSGRQRAVSPCVTCAEDSCRRLSTLIANGNAVLALSRTEKQALIQNSRILGAQTTRNLSDGLKQNEEVAEQPEESTDSAEFDSVHVISDTEKVQGPRTKHEFQAETRQLLDIVARSLYSEKEVFIREIISNSSDALEKLRHLQLTGAEVSDLDLPFEIHMTTNEEKGTFTIQDYGLGMTEEELIDNLGTIARSGSKAFVKQLQEQEGTGSAAKDSIIGQFGVGFYSLFMVGDKVDVYTRSYQPGSKGYLWTSDGLGSYEVAEADGVARGTKITVHLKPDSKVYSLKAVVEDVVKKYSNFVGFPIFLNGTKLNTVQALWMLDERNVSHDQHEEFYQFVANTSDKPRYELIYRTDAPLNIRSIFYIPTMTPELYAFGQIEPGVSLYSRKVLIQSKSPNILPKWLRFVKGVVDSEDIPLNLSRELLQDSALIRKLSSILENKIVRFLVDQMKKDRVKYEKFFKDFGLYIREGVLTTESQDTKEEIAKLLRFESSREKAGTQKTIAEYVNDMPPTQKEIFYLCAPSRDLAESSPYFEALKSQEVEVLFTYDENDDIVLHGLKQFKRKTVVSAENYLMSSSSKPPNEPDAKDDSPRLSETEATDLTKWLSNTLGREKVAEVKVSHRLASHPAMITVPDMAAARRWLKFIRAGPNTEMQAHKFQILQPTLEINPGHELIISLNNIKDASPELAKLLAEQIFDNGLIAAGLMDDARAMVGRLNSLLAKTLEKVAKSDQ